MATTCKYQRLRDELARQNMSAWKLSQLADMYHPDLYNALNGKKQFYLGWKERISAVLGVPVEELFADEEE